MILIFNLKRKKDSLESFFGSDIYIGTKRVRFFVNLAEARGLGFYFAKSFRSSSLGKN